MFERRAGKPKQEEMWVTSQELPKATPGTFYRRVNETLEKIGFAKEVWAICESAYAEASRGGRPGIDPVVYLKMLTVGFFENLPSERAIASRCADSLSIRGYLGYGLTEETPDHSSLSVIRDRLSVEQLEAIHRVLLKALHVHGLLKGRQLGIDASVIEANASLRALESRNTEESYWDYVKRLAAEAGIDPNDTKAVRRFDKKRPDRKTSNKDWKNPHDPDAKVGRTKDGATDMIYKPEHVSDLESGAIIHTEVRLGDEADNDESLCERVMTAVDALSEAMPNAPLEKLAQELCADEGYYALGPITELQACGVRTIIGDPQAERRKFGKLTEEERQACQRAKRAVGSKSGKAALRRRGEHLERAFCHILDHGNLRRATLRGQENLTKRQKLGALSYNLSLLMRHLTGVGTAKQALAGVRGALEAVLGFFQSALVTCAHHCRLSLAFSFIQPFTLRQWRLPA
jgi:transposase